MLGHGKGMLDGYKVKGRGDKMKAEMSSFI